MDLPANPKSHEDSQNLSLISIPQLSPNLEDASRYSVQAVVTLVWPFSSSNRLFSLLLAEPDFRLRNQNGQIRVTFCGRCAEEVAHTKIGIGDTVTLSLQGAQWTENLEIRTTPGKSLVWELQFKNRVKLEAVRDGKKTAALDYLQPESPRQDALTLAPTTPALLSSRLPSPITLESISERWDTPAFLRTKRLRSRSPVPSTYNVFAEEDGYVPSIGRKRARFSFPSSEWRLLDESDDLAEENVGNDDNWFDSDEELLDEDADNDKQEGLAEATLEAEASAMTAPITRPMEDGPGSSVQHVESDKLVQDLQVTYDNTQELQVIVPGLKEITVEPNLPDTQLSFITPRLNPVMSSTLPTPSPLVQTPVDPTEAFEGPSSDISMSHRRLSHPQSTETIDHNNHYNVSSDAFNTDVPGNTEFQELGTQTPYVDSRDVESKYQEIGTLEVAQDGNSLQSLHGHFSSSKFTSLNYYAVEQGDEPAAFHADEPESLNEARDADDLDLESTHDDRIEQSGNEPVKAYDSVFDHGAKADIDSSESEGVVDNETSSQVQIIEVDDTSSRGGYRKEILEADTAEDEESNSEDRHLSDEAEKGEDEVMSKQSYYSDISAEPDEESADEDYRETLISNTSQRVVHPEVIVLDSDSEDEPPIFNAPSGMQSNGGLNDSSSPSNHEDDENEIPSQEVDYMEDRDAYSDEEEEETDEDMMPSETLVSGDENAGPEQMYTHEVYDMDERVDAEAEGTTEHESPNNIMNEIGSAPRQLDTPRTIRADGSSKTSRIDHDTVTRQWPGNSNPLDIGQMPEEDDAFDVKEEQSPVSEDQSLTQEQSLSSTRIMQRLAYRTVSPVPVPTPPSTVNNESQYTYVETIDPASVDHGSSPGPKSTEAEVSHNRRHRWIDGSDERHLQHSGHLLPREERPVPELTDEDVDAPEKLDEVVLIEECSIGLTEQDSHEVAESEQPELQSDPTLSPIETPKLPVYATLAMLGERSNEVVDVIAVVVVVSSAAASTSKTDGYRLKLRVTDISMAGTTVIVKIVRPTDTSLPIVTEGDVILLRAFQIQTYNDSIQLTSSNDSGWAIINTPAEHPHATDSNVTFGERERGYVKLLQSWFREEGGAMAADHMLQLSIHQEEKQPSPFSAASSDAGSLESLTSGSVSRSRPRRRKSHRRVTIHELRDGRRYTEFGWLDSDSIHELRDGTVYAHSFDRNEN